MTCLGLGSGLGLGLGLALTLSLSLPLSPTPSRALRRALEVHYLRAVIRHRADARRDAAQEVHLFDRRQPVGRRA
jgi:hypothetical protein